MTAPLNRVENRRRIWSTSFLVSISLVTLLCITNNMFFLDPLMCVQQREPESPWKEFLQDDEPSPTLPSLKTQEQLKENDAAALTQTTSDETTPDSDKFDKTKASASAAKEHAQLHELRVLLGCNATDWIHCLQVASRVAAQRTADEAAAKKLVIAKSRTDAAYINIDLIDHHPALVPLKQKYLPAPEWANRNILPDISIVGLPKAGTSQLYHILTQHSAATPFYAGDKEYCMRLPAPLMHPQNDKQREQLQKGLYDWHTNLYTQSVERNNSEKTTINGCLSEQELYLSLHYLKNSSTSTVAGTSLQQEGKQRKYVVLLRDPADWLWAAWNFWVDMGLDSKTDTPGSWAASSHHYRSPELFHELVLSAHKTNAGNRLVEGLRRQTVLTGRRVVALAGRDNVLFLRNEDMLPAVVDQQGGLLERLSNFSGLDRANFRDGGLRTIRNCNDVKGEASKCGNSTSSAYEITGHREMLESTRTLIYLHFSQECQIWAKEFNIVYSDCLNAGGADQTE
jgi:hypothetical protein